MMNSMSFAKGIGVGIVVGSAIGMAVSHNPPKKASVKRSVMGKAIRAVGDIVEGIGESIGM